MNRIFEDSELIVNSDGSIFHLHIRPGEIGEYVLLVGDPQRVDMIASFFSTIKHTASNREFYSITGEYQGKLITALSTGIGTDNIDIVLNELDAATNIDFETRKARSQLNSLKLIRIGTSGSVQPAIKPGSYLFSQSVIGFDGLLNFYKARNEVCDLSLENAFIQHSRWPDILAKPYCVSASNDLGQLFSDSKFIKGITMSANGFYAPQGRELRGEIAYPIMFRDFHKFNYRGQKITNFEMECSALYGLSKIFGHQAATICLIIANRYNKTYLGNYQSAMKILVETILNRITNDAE